MNCFRLRKLPFCILELPVEFTVDLSSVEVFEKEDATFTCELSKADIQVTWLVKGKKIKPSKKYVIDSQDYTHILIIKDTTLKDAGEVSIVAEDCKSTAQLLVKGTIYVFISA